MTAVRQVVLADNRDLPAATADAMRQVRVQIAALADRRDAVIRANGLDAEFCYGDANWKQGAPNDFLLNYQYVKDGDYDVLNRLRFWAQPFTGYRLISLGDAEAFLPRTPVPAGYDDWLRAHRAEPDLWVARWQANRPLIAAKHLYRPPRMLGEVGWDVDGVVVSHDTCAYQERVCLLRDAGVLGRLEQLGRPPRIIEIGGGYGALANALLAILPDASYVICDLPESLMFSGLYSTAIAAPPRILSTVERYAPTPCLTLLPNYLFEPLRDAPAHFDLAINTLSLSEMSEHQVRTYATGLAAMLQPDGVFFEQNADNRHIGMTFAKTILGDYFAHHRPVTTDIAYFQGPADVWANHDLQIPRDSRPA
jgi:hypothetical protein